LGVPVLLESVNLVKQNVKLAARTFINIVIFIIPVKHSIIACKNTRLYGAGIVS